MTAPADLVPGEFVKIALHRTMTSFFSAETVQQRVDDRRQVA